MQLGPNTFSESIVENFRPTKRQEFLPHGVSFTSCWEYAAYNRDAKHRRLQGMIIRDKERGLLENK